MPSLLCTGTVRTSFPCTQISYAAQEHLQVRPLSRFLPLDPPDPLFPHLSPYLWYFSSGHWSGAHPPRPFPESNMARTTAPLTLEAPHPCHASTPHATPGGSHHNSTGAHLSRTLCTAQRSDLLSLTLHGSVFSTAHSLLPAHHGASPATSLGRRSSAARAHQWCHLPPPSVLVLLFLRPELLSGGHELVARHMPQSPSGLHLPALSALWPRPSPTALGHCSL